MLAELRAGLDSLAGRRAALLAELAAAKPEQLRYRPEEGAWSLLEVAHHLVRVEGGTLAALERRSGRTRRRSLRYKLLHPLVKGVLRSGLRVKVPSRRMLPDATASLAEIESQWREVAAELERVLEPVPESERGAEAIRHPIAGPLDFGETLEFLRTHFDHHLRQVRRIRSAPGFPADGATRDADGRPGGGA